MVCKECKQVALNDEYDVAHIPLYLYPFLNTVSKNRPFEYLRLTSLGVIGALVKVCRVRTPCYIRPVYIRFRWTILK